MKVRVGHAPLEFGDSPGQHTHDIEKIFAHAVDRRWAWITGTEAGPGSNNTGPELLRVGKANGYKLFVPSVQLKRGQMAPGAASTDCWVAVRKDIITSGWETGFVPAIPGSTELYEKQGLPNASRLRPKWGPKGVVHVGFVNDKLGKINVAAGHPLTKGRRDNKATIIHGVNHYDWVTKFEQVLAGWGKENGKGKDLAFCGLDQNQTDNTDDTFRGGPFTSAADETKNWQNTGHGSIDVIASYNQDSRVRAIDWNVLDDSEFQLFVDHYLCEATFEVKPL